MKSNVRSSASEPDDSPIAARRRVISNIGGGTLALALGWSVGVAADMTGPPAGLSAPSKPTIMPAFELPTVAGSTLRSDSLRGQVVIVRYWASW